MSIKITCDYCGADQKIFTYTATVKKSNQRFVDSENPEYLKEDYFDKDYIGPEFIRSIDLCGNCYREIRGNFYYIFSKGKDNLK